MGAAAPELVLLIPGLFGPRGAAGDDAGEGALTRLLARAAAVPSGRGGLAADLFGAFGIGVHGAAELPAAPLTLLADGGAPGDDYCLRADPVHLRVGQDRVVLTGAGPVRMDEAAALCAEIGRHLADAGLGHAVAPEAPDPARWYLRLPRAPAVDFTPLDTVLGQDIRPHLPQGGDARAWRRLLNEIQMLLHASEVNHSRGARGEAEINSVWFWGGGTLPAAGSSRIAQVWSDHPLARGLALNAGLAPRPLPADAAAWFGAAGAGRHLVVLDRLAAPALLGDVEEWYTGMQALRERWFEPLWTLVRGGRVAAIDIGGGGALDYHISPKLARRWWRRTRPFTDHVRESRQGQEGQR